MLRLIYCAAISLFLCWTAFPQSATFPGLNGLGSSTPTCLDRDGDGYGTGPGCIGPDADDLDSTVHTGPQGVTKYGTLSAFINHLEGYTPSHIWYLAPASPTTGCLANGGTTAQCTGSDSNSCEDNINAPCLTGSHIQNSVTAGMAVVFRDGWNGRYSSGSGASGSPIILMGYPGELPVIDQSTSAGALIITTGQSYLIVDTFKTQNSSCMQGGDNNYNENPHTFHDNVFKHIEGTKCYQGFGPTAGIQNDTLEDSVFHDNQAGGGQAGVYWGSGCVPSSGAKIQRVISYNNGYSGIHLNGWVNGATISQNLVYDNLVEGIAFESGVNTSTVTDNIVFTNNGAEFEIYSYQNGLGPVTNCDASYYTATNATWANGTATITIGTHGIIVGQYAYINGFTPVGFNCTGTGSPNTGTGCVVTAVTSTTISYAIASNPGSYVSGGYATGDVGDQANNLIENNTFYHGNRDYLGDPVGNSSAIWISSRSNTTGLPVVGDLGHNTFRNNIAVNYGDISSVYRYAPIAFDSTNGASFLATSVFDHNLTFQSNGIDSTTAAYGLYQTCAPTCSGQAVYDDTGTALNGGPPLSGIATGYTITGGTDGDPSFMAASATYYNTPSLFNFGLLSGSPALNSGTGIGSPANDIFGNLFPSTPSMGAIAPAQAGSPATPPTVSTTAPTNSTVSGTPSSGAGWQDLANTQLNSVCPADGFGGINYPFTKYCDAVVTAWSGAAADTKRNRLIIWGGGHTDYSGNEVYSLNLGTASPTLTRLTNPSDFTQNPSGCPDTNVVDGTPVSRHTYGGLVYLPVQDKMFSFSGALAPCGGPLSTKTYTLDLSKSPPTWLAMDPINGYSISGYQSNTALCAYDPNTQTVICNLTGVFFRYDPSTNTNTLLSTGQLVPYQSFGAIDPKRKLFIFMGTEYQSTTPEVKVVDISSGSNFAVQDWSSQVTGCAALAGASYPGLTYDSVLDRIVGWPNAGNTVYLFNPDSKTCTAQTLSNGPTNTLASTAGTFGRFQYFPGLNAYAVVSLATLDAYQLTLSTAAPASSTAAPASSTTAPASSTTAPASSTTTPASSTTAPASSPCDLNKDGVVNSLDIQLAINEALGIAACGNAALQQAGQCDVVDVQRVINAALGGACHTGQ